MPCAKGCCPSPREHFKSLRFFATGEGTTHKRETQLSEDMEAYKRLRKNGLQPPRIDGCAVIEKYATTKEEIERGSVNWKRAENAASRK